MIFKRKPKPAHDRWRYRFAFLPKRIGAYRVWCQRYAWRHTEDPEPIKPEHLAGLYPRAFFCELWREYSFLRDGTDCRAFRKEVIYIGAGLSLPSIHWYTPKPREVRSA